MKANTRKLSNSSDGAFAVEAALIAPVFLGFLIFAFELLAILFFSFRLDHAVTLTADDIRFGKVQSAIAASGGGSEQYYKQSICSFVRTVNCENKIKVDLTMYSSEGVAASGSAVNRPVNSSSIVYVQVELEAPISIFLQKQNKPVTLRTAQLLLTEPF